MSESYLSKMREFFKSLGIEVCHPMENTGNGFIFTATLAPCERPKF